ncbi:hypothetical protein CLIM01_11978 [Colletotrichum limetticola]|uniref:Uncharacterized protein n=1 Tax=Colletotrichum limetticola TaxID=1209924 RepID=A0ABQ9PL11_9PEZI|nr:hypothetical protein CLIM01_11978 [Colletotrichum limetticola]
MEQFQADTDMDIDTAVAKKVNEHVVDLEQHEARDREKNIPTGGPHRPVLAIVVDMENPTGHVRIYDKDDNQVGVVQGRKNKDKTVIVSWKPGWQYVFYGAGACAVYHAYARQDQEGREV